ncbi:putative membrane-anchored protein [Sphingobium xenophagum]|uniref:Membrane-anchored protein n=1 Tax=Sphingobium xenophagum TaxID=121428 RepID=A0ABU1WWF7_SPHXE|nr:hypothetical protein [Sphingobium xenophagum]MDR7153636.1 putative membrane-anchored protein [Sphingobium xenophagum]
MFDKRKRRGERRRPPWWFMFAVMTGLAIATWLLVIMLYPLTS